eukprot:GHVT01032075.1.p1 GENE.GHVT01032075.1~~GHVT01032075.1.p1  ORF type:complete len:109 (+),score=14.78 GHVT01032075.1:91-417(+)
MDEEAKKPTSKGRPTEKRKKWDQEIDVPPQTNDEDLHLLFEWKERQGKEERGGRREEGRKRRDEGSERREGRERRWGRVETDEERTSMGILLLGKVDRPSDTNSKLWH